MKKQSKTDVVRSLLAEGELIPSQIAKKVGVSKSYVYNVRQRLAKGKAAKSRQELVTARVATIPSEGARTNGNGSGNGHLKIQPIDYSMANRLDPCQHNIVEHVTTFRDNGGVDKLKEARKLIDALIVYEQRHGG